MPPIRPTALAMPAPVALSEVGYTYSKQTRIKKLQFVEYHQCGQVKQMLC